MKNKKIAEEKKVNKITNAKHNKQFWLQIMIPLIGFILFVALGWIIFGITNVGNISSWSSLSIIFLSVFILLVCLLTLIVLIFATIGLSKLLNLLPEKTFIAQKWLQMINNKVKIFSDKIASPLITSKSWFLTLNIRNIHNKDGEKNE